MSSEEIRLRYYPDPVLRVRAAPLPKLNGSVREIARAMFRIMYDAAGIGLAGPQVGWSGRIFVVNLSGDPEARDQELVFVNPVISLAEGEASGEEGCLSLPGVRLDVPRAERVTVAATDLAGSRFELCAIDLLARCIQHEVDHLDGILFIARASMTQRMTVRKELKELERKYKESGGRR